MLEPSPFADAVDSPETAVPRLLLPGTAVADLTPLRLVLEPAGLVLELKNPDLVLGRHSESDVRLPLPDVSRRHCRLFFLSGAWHVQDLKSLNGVFVNDEPVEEAELRDGDRLRIGGFSFNVQLNDAPESSASLLNRLVGALPNREPSSLLRRRAS
jgi:pSer/pThr/pTyr-binding forkhead associated (FHA) protein